jgi:deoxyribodipyrimidine photo-lyase
MRTLVWFRGKDLRIADHAPLRDALASGEIVPLFVLQPRYFTGTRARELPHRIQFLLDALRAPSAEIEARG